MSEELSGRELELEVAKRVFNFRWFHCEANEVERNQFLSPGTAEVWRELGWVLTEIDGMQDDQFNDDIPKFARSIEAAMRVVEKMREQGWSFACTLYEGKLPYASFCKGTVKSSRNAEAESLAEAICLAALAAIESTHTAPVSA
ncbi:MAG TPA: hypothetical protein VL866_24230 [Pyrinomonadaceae bacterium]|nr:hypothetical protein [Pyrinomonadaceae bacterium]